MHVHGTHSIRSLGLRPTHSLKINRPGSSPGWGPLEIVLQSRCLHLAPRGCDYSSQGNWGRQGRPLLSHRQGLTLPVFLSCCRSQRGTSRAPPSVRSYLLRRSPRCTVIRSLGYLDAPNSLATHCHDNRRAITLALRPSVSLIPAGRVRTASHSDPSHIGQRFACPFVVTKGVVVAKFADPVL